MEFIEETRKLISNTGYFKEKDTGVVYNEPYIYLGKYSSPDDYEECAEVDYLEYLEFIKKQEEEIEQARQAEQQEEIIEEPIIEDTEEEN